MVDASTDLLITAYGLDRSQVEMATYAVAEQIHQHFCLPRGIVTRHEPRVDQQVAVQILSSLAGSDWWLVHRDQRIWPVEPEVATDDST